ncbi:DegT/DnrJ/EryC1/StrS family aminotransferase [Virgibacillus alimentarius]|uniref:DegT/DnrJ/EryC1/StrS family aminotransferase n=1 Tax=Virgibacillus alimentarius TaxID=698769 RepID=UPI00049379D1|nr:MULTISPECIES: DegT/DnrJ/EryC1/StrS family aminotransferase [Virgibacillus]HLR66615.1 DegT/DnrJ/EryC1/StrS family aminotransferase [Virgibacillus sp.]
MPDRIPMVDLKEELRLIRTPLLEEITEVLDSGDYILGEKGKKLEEMVAGYVGASYGIGVANGTDALQLSLASLNVGPGDEVITTPFTFFATGETIAQVGAKPVFVDIEEETYNMDPFKLEEAITPNTKAVIVVHLYGKAANMKEIMKIAKAHHLWIIEDACQAIGTEADGKRTGAIGDIGCFSFFPSKNLGAFGDAGMVTTNHKKVDERIKKLRNHGSETKYCHDSIGMNSRLDELQAAILLVKLYYLDVFLHNRKEIARKYTENLHPSLKKPYVATGREHTFHQYCIELDRRDELALELKNTGIASAIYYPVPLHLQKAFHYLSYKKGDFPVAEKASERILGLPIFPMLTYENQNHIIATVNKFIENNGENS